MNGEAESVRMRPTLAAVARLAGVSNSTASLAFSGSGPVSFATRERVLAAARELDYAGPDPRARSLRRGRSGIVGIVVEERVRDAFRDPIKIAMLDGMSQELAAIEAGILVLSDAGGPASHIEDAPMDAVVLIGCSPRLDDSVAAMRQRGIPIVAIEAAPGLGMHTISQDNRSATLVGAVHLRDLGHTRVAVVTLPLDRDRRSGPLTRELEDRGNANTALERLAGARDVFPDLAGYVTQGSYVEEGVRAARALLADPSDRPTAVIAQSDLLAAGVIRGAEQLGLAVPEDLSVIGFDGVRVDGLWPYDLTTLVQPAFEKGAAAGHAIVELLDGRAPEPMLFRSTFHLGNTTAAPRASQG
jgi:DNA-binding LacI/PurR family transcriptional regulator